MGVTRVKVVHFVIGNAGMLPGTIVYIFLGTTISDIADTASGKAKNDQQPLLLTLLIVGTILAFIGIIYVSLVAKRKLEEEIAK